MRSILLSAVALLFVGCGDPQPNVYKIAIDTTPLRSLAGSCYEEGAAPEWNGTVTNIVTEQTWEWWPGLEGNSYLQIGDTGGFNLGDAEDVSINGTIVGQGKTFTATRVTEWTFGEFDDTHTETVTVSLKNDPGGVVEGTLTLSSQHTCSPADCGVYSCEVSLPFVGRRLDLEQNSFVVSQGF